MTPRCLINLWRFTFHVGSYTTSGGMEKPFYIKPKAQVVWMGDADNHIESNGTVVFGEGDGNSQTRLGVRAYINGHNKIDEGKDRTFQPYVEVNWVHNTKDFGNRMDGVLAKEDGAENVQFN